MSKDISQYNIYKYINISFSVIMIVSSIFNKLFASSISFPIGSKGSLIEMISRIKAMVIWWRLDG